jgi:2,3,4,5-tetrahydropyridine-2,6-dicarboxylate N-succinyltransferase
MRTSEELRDAIDDLWERSNDLDATEALALVRDLRGHLQSGSVRAAEPRDGGWHVNAWVKRGILLGFRAGRVQEYPAGETIFFDKDTVPPRRFKAGDGVRFVPGGSSVREGAYLAPGVVCMPPTYVNVGAYVDEGTMLDSHVLVGSCAQIGRRVHVSAGVQIGGVLEPPNAMPVVVEDDVFLGGTCGVFEGTIVRRAAVLAAGVVLTRATAVYDLVKETIRRGTDSGPLVIPEGAVVVPGSRPASGAFATSQGVQLYAPVIVKYRDRSTNASVVLEDALRETNERA